MALDHALFLSHKSPDELWIRYWINQKSVILGKGQLLAEEVDTTVCKEKKVGIYRRISGGGAVYHDLGNLNVSMIFNVGLLKTKSIPSTIALIMQKVLSSFEEMFPSYRFDVKGTSIFMGDRKISGSASYKKGTKILFHFTILVNADLATLNEVLISREPNPKSSRKSRYAPTVNLKMFDLNTWRLHFLEKILGFVPSPPSLSWNKENGDIHIPVEENGNVLSIIPDKTTERLAHFLDHYLYKNQEWIQEGRWAKIYNAVMRKADPELGYNPF